MYAIRTIFAATIAVMAARVELPGMRKGQRSCGERTIACKRHTIPHVFLRRKIGCNRNDTKGQTEDDELE
jgi:hypothetical protein